jgi:hypothetical protein
MQEMERSQQAMAQRMQNTQREYAATQRQMQRSYASGNNIVDSRLLTSQSYSTRQTHIILLGEIR